MGGIKANCCRTRTIHEMAGKEHHLQICVGDYILAGLKQVNTAGR